ncbi:MAG: ATP-binding cassette domain-containing protein [Chloroflexi bacterium]|nr:MAG: ATP-binding cassette domain-containing protein [Chloroflexota bacterium]
MPEIARRRRIRELLERFELEDAAGRVLYTYSRGMAQKVALIRATLHEPRWLFCDEPTVGLDPVAAADMRRYLEEQRDRGAAVIVTTHQLAEAELLAHRIAIMRGGHVVAAGSLPELRRWAGAERRFTARLRLMRSWPGGRPSSRAAWPRRERLIWSCVRKRRAWRRST